MNENFLLIVGALALVYVGSKKKTGSSKGTATVQTNPASRNPNTGVGNAPNSLNTQISNAATGALNGISAVTGAVKSVAGLGSGSRPGATVGVASSSSPASGTGNDSFDAQDSLETMSGSDMGEYSDSFLDDSGSNDSGGTDYTD